MATQTCPQCGAKNPTGDNFCSRCGTPLRARGGDGGPRRKRGGCLQWVIGIVVAILVLKALSQVGGGGQQQSAAPAATSTPAATDTVGPTETPLATATTGPTQTPVPTETAVSPRQATAEARAAIRAARAATAVAARATRAQGTADAQTTAVAREPLQADFRTFVGKLYGIQQICIDAGKVASASFQAVTQGTGNAVDAYTDAQNAQDACDAAKTDFATLSVPDSLSAYKLSDTSTDLFVWATDAGNMWNDAKSVLQNNNDIASAADFKKMVSEMDSANLAVAPILVQASMTLNVPVESITPVPPGANQ